MLITPAEYVCRVCGNEGNIHVQPKPTERGLEIDVNGSHKLARARCSECDEERTHVLRVALEEGSV